MAAVLSNEINNTEKISTFVAECQRMGIPILAPDVNRSMLKFAPERQDSGQKAIRFGLAGIKNVGEAAMAMVERERTAHGEFKSLEDFAGRLDTKSVNRKILENLIKAGAFDFTMERRDEMFSRVGQIIAGSSAAQKDRATGQTSLFDMNELMSAAAVPDIIEEDRVVWNQREYLTHEKELLGFYVTGHPLDEYRGIIEKGKFSTIAELPQMKAGKKPERFAGIIGEVTVKYTKRESKPFAILIFEDFTGITEVMVWNETYQKSNPLLVKGNVIEIKAKIEQDTRTETNRLMADEIKAIEYDPEAVLRSVTPLRNGVSTGSGQAPNPVRPTPAANGNGHHDHPPFATPIRVSLDAVRDTISAITILQTAALDHPGDRPLHLTVRRANGQCVTLEAGHRYRVSDDFLSAAGIELWIDC